MRSVTMLFGQSGSQNSLATLLYECANEFFCVLFQDLIDLVEDGIDVFIESLMTFGDVRGVNWRFVDLFTTAFSMLLPA